MHHAHGIEPGEVLDPERLAEEIAVAGSRASRTDQWCWTAEALSGIRAFQSALVTLDSAETTARMKLYDSGGLPNINPPDDADTFIVPYDEGSTGVESVSWNGKTIELIIVLCSLQYWRQINGYSPWNGTNTKAIRVQFGIEIDGAFVPGSGPSGWPLSRGSRGAGLGDDSAAPVMMTTRVLLPGPHTVRLVAGQAPATLVATSGEDQKRIEEVPPSTGVNIASRALHVIRLAMGASYAP